jgi:hypothetical protein
MSCLLVTGSAARKAFATLSAESVPPPPYHSAYAPFQGALYLGGKAASFSTSIFATHDPATHTCPLLGG